MECWLCIRLHTVCAYADSGRMLEHIPGLPDLILFWMNDVSVIRVSRYGITRGTLSGKHVFTLIWIIMNDSSFKIVSNWAVLTVTMHIFVLSLLSVPGDPMRALLMSKYTACIFSLKILQI